LSGVLALISIVSILMMGTVAGSFFHMEDNRFKRGVILIICGGTLAFFGWLWSLDFPMVANMWTSSYSLFAAGIAGAVLGLLSILFDMEDGHKIAYLFIIPATCVLTALAGPPLLKMMILDYWRMPNSEVKLGKGLQQLASGGSTQATWGYTILFMLVWWIVMAIAYHRRKWIREKYGID
jgi:predicted acyltransferase